MTVFAFTWKQIQEKIAQKLFRRGILDTVLENGKTTKNKRKRYYSQQAPFLRTSKPKRIFTRTFVKAKLSKKFFFSTRIVHCEKKNKFTGTKANKNISQLKTFNVKEL